jgi:hypothetical protein
MTTDCIATLSPEQVHAAVKARGTRIVTVRFIKKGGSVRKINGLFRATSHMVGGDRGEAQHETLRAKGLIAIYSLADRGWRSFAADRVIEIV